MKHLAKLFLVGLLLVIPVRYFLDWADIAPFEYFEEAPPPPPPPGIPFSGSGEPMEVYPTEEGIEIVGIDPALSTPEPTVADDAFKFVLVLSEEPSDAWFDQLSGLLDERLEMRSVISASGDTLSLSCSKEAFTDKFFPELKALIGRCNAALRDVERARTETIENVAEKLSLPLEFGSIPEETVMKAIPVEGN
jgi:hypothetical protein